MTHPRVPYECDRDLRSEEGSTRWVPHRLLVLPSRLFLPPSIQHRLIPGGIIPLEGHRHPWLPHHAHPPKTRTLTKSEQERAGSKVAGGILSWSGGEPKLGIRTSQNRTFGSLAKLGLVLGSGDAAGANGCCLHGLATFCFRVSGFGSVKCKTSERLFQSIDQQ